MPLILLAPMALAAEPAAEPPAAPPVPGLVDATTVVPALQVELRYSTPDNFLGKDVYGDLEACRLQGPAAQKLAEADRLLRATHPELRLHAWDCARPHAVQVAMWAIVKGTPQQGYVADPARGSVHNFGCAVDLTVATEAGVPIDMGTPFDHFGIEAQPRHEAELVAAGKLSEAQVANRRILRDAMTGAGFLAIPNEWWHFDCLPAAEARARFPMVE